MAAAPTPRSILQVNSFFRDSTGADRYFRDLSTLLSARGHRVVSLCARHRGDEPSEWSRFFPEGALSAPGDAPSPLRALRDATKFVFHLEARRRAAEIVRETHPDVVHAHNLFHHLSPSVLAPFRESGAPVVMTLHDYKLVCPNYMLYTQGSPCTACRGGRFWHAVTRRCVRDSYLKSSLCAVENTLHRTLSLYLRGVDRFVAPSRFLRDRFVDCGFPEERIAVVPNFTPLAGQDEAGTKREGDHVLFAGRLVAVKGVLTLLRAWKETRARRELRLVLAGGGPLESELRRFVEAEGLKEIVVRGPLGREELAELMTRAALQIVPSEWWEPCPLVVLEAQALGRCVVAAAIGGIPELVEDGVTGLLFPPGDAPGLAAAIDRAVYEPGLRSRLGAAARARTRELYSPDAHYRSILALYRELGVTAGTESVPTATLP